MTDQEIIDCLRNQQYRRAMKHLYAMLPDVRQYLKRHGGTADDAEDIFQDALVIAYQKVQAPGFILTASLSSYIMGIVRICWLQECRKRNKMPTGVMPDQELTSGIEYDESPHHAATAAFELLGEKCRRLLILFYFSKKSLRDIAAIMSFNDEQVARNQKYRCMQKARNNYLHLYKDELHGK